MKTEPRRGPSQKFHAQQPLLKMKDRVQESVVYLVLDSYQLIFGLDLKKQSLTRQSLLHRNSILYRSRYYAHVHDKVQKYEDRNAYKLGAPRPRRDFV